VTTDDRRRALDDAIESLDYVWAQVTSRRDGITQAEYEWEPAQGVKSIAWREGHIASDCLETYCWQLDGGPQPDVSSDDWTLPVDGSGERMQRAWTTFRQILIDRGPDWAYEKLGDKWGPYAESSRLALALHAQHEIAHHGAEIALLRDLWAARSASTGSG
jgi:hypothetical protein